MYNDIFLQEAIATGYRPEPQSNDIFVQEAAAINSNTEFFTEEDTDALLDGIIRYTTEFRVFSNYSAGIVSVNESFSSIITAIKNAIFALWEKIKEFFGTIIKKIKNVLNGNAGFITKVKKFEVFMNNGGGKNTDTENVDEATIILQELFGSKKKTGTRTAGLKSKEEYDKNIGTATQQIDDYKNQKKDERDAKSNTIREKEEAKKDLAAKRDKLRSDLTRLYDDQRDEPVSSKKEKIQQKIEEKESEKSEIQQAIDKTEEDIEKLKDEKKNLQNPENDQYVTSRRKYIEKEKHDRFDVEHKKAIDSMSDGQYALSRQTIDYLKVNIGDREQALFMNMYDVSINASDINTISLKDLNSKSDYQRVTLDIIKVKPERVKNYDFDPEEFEKITKNTYFGGREIGAKNYTELIEDYRTVISQFLSLVGFMDKAFERVKKTSTKIENSYKKTIAVYEKQFSNFMNDTGQPLSDYDKEEKKRKEQYKNNELIGTDDTSENNVRAAEVKLRVLHKICGLHVAYMRSHIAGLSNCTAREYGFLRHALTIMMKKTGFMNKATGNLKAI